MAVATATRVAHDPTADAPRHRTRTRTRRGVPAALASWLPRGRPLPREVWASRHRWVMAVLWLQCAGLLGFALWRGVLPVHAVLDVAAPVALALVASSRRPGETVRSTAASLGLVAVAVLLVHVAGGAIEAHFLFFVNIPVVAVYQRWVPFGLAIGVVLLHHGVMGTLDPAGIYSHAAGQRSPWVWAGVHAAAIAAACLGAVVSWRLHERSRDAEVALSERLLFQAQHDPLTGLPTRRVFLARLEDALAAARADGARAPAVLVLDLDGFKQVNDTFGHHHGDLLLVETAHRLVRCLGPDAVVTRLGGDEFAVLVRDADRAGGERAAGAVVEALGVAFEVDDLGIDLEVSVGLAVPDETGTDASTLLRHADCAMYAAKEQRLGWTSYDGSGPDAQTTAGRLTLLGELRRAIEREEIVLHFQPQVDLGTGRPVGVEALARWQHPVRGLLPPSEFIPLVERSSLSVPFTTLVLEQSLDRLVAWEDDGLVLTVAVNVSARCLLDTGLPQRVAEALGARGLDPARLCLEITETTVMNDPDTAIGTLHALRALGLRVSLDDFGTGYSSMSYLRRLPLDELKIDRSFVRELSTGQEGERRRDTALVRHIVDLAHQLALPVVAEGIEDVATQDLLRDLGCDTAQGFHLARPMPAAEVVDWARRRAA